ncbi:MAG: GNAT family N-acetyltransferase [Candidatus Peribacteraceae bacterium]|jgi:ribosomal protein S18 acetylase RimI-like enzyme|nr:hypothetical protein [bacterium]MDP6561906.1 GNAT family N-acetyltransferase [Candidatus Peribacteraceae bacterium]|tara:strand:+ start:30215 stop:30691 length:477 start_codon:yes stop_codon:yes gene_type:complete
MIKIREGKIEDFKKLNQDWAWSQADWQRSAQKKTIEAISSNNQSFVVIEDGNELIGELHIEWNKKEDSDAANGTNRAYLFALRIHPKHRGKGLGTQLMNSALDLIRSRGFNEATIGAYKDESHLKELYIKWGFVELLKDVLEETDEYSKYYELYLQRL